MVLRSDRTIPSTGAPDPPASDLRTIPGWLSATDEMLLRFVLLEQRRAGITGDLAELGVYMGKCAVLFGDHVQPGETFTVADLFEGAAVDPSNAAENSALYSELTEGAFRANYRRFHDELPVIVHGPSTAIRERAAAGAHRLVHVDASHLYENVRADVDTARTLLHADGIAVFDDYRTKHTPGTAAAVWEAVASTGLVPLVLSPAKFYGTWGDPGEWQRRLAGWLPTSGLEHELQLIAGHPVLRVWPRSTVRSPMERFVAALTPPVLLRVVRRVSNR